MWSGVGGHPLTRVSLHTVRNDDLKRKKRCSVVFNGKKLNFLKSKVFTGLITSTVKVLWLDYCSTLPVGKFDLLWVIYFWGCHPYIPYLLNHFLSVTIYLIMNTYVLDQGGYMTEKVASSGWEGLFMKDPFHVSGLYYL
jgi:hypothetical protein